MADKYRENQNNLSDQNDKYRIMNENVIELTNTLSNMNDRLEAVNEKMENASNTMTDVTPLQKIKTAITQIRNETRQMDIRTGVVTHAIMQHKLREKSKLNKKKRT